MATLKLTLKKQWFEMINSGNKTEEYREVKTHWIKQLISQGFTRKDYQNNGAVELILAHPNHWAQNKIKKFEFVEFRNGYSKKSPKIICEFKGIEIRKGNTDWGAIENEIYFVIKIGPIIQRTNF